MSENRQRRNYFALVALFARDMAERDPARRERWEAEAEINAQLAMVEDAKLARQALEDEGAQP